MFLDMDENKGDDVEQIKAWITGPAAPWIVLLSVVALIALLYNIVAS